MFLELWSLSLPKSIMNATGQDFLKMNKVVLTFNFVDEVLGRGGGGGGVGGEGTSRNSWWWCAAQFSKS